MKAPKAATKPRIEMSDKGQKKPEWLENCRPVVSELGKLWASGQLSTEEYFLICREKREKREREARERIEKKLKSDFRTMRGH